MDVNPGPIDEELLHGQKEHISNFLWDNENYRNILKTNEGHRNIKKFKLNEEQKRLLVQVGFGAFINISVFNQLDATLLSALVERWRSETNTFHFPVGEMTVTLEDVYFILGIPVCGEPIILQGYRKPKYLVSGSSFGKYTDGTSRTYQKGGLVLSWLAERFAELPVKYRKADLVQYTKAYILVVIGSILFPDSSAISVHASWLPFVDDLSQIRGYAWGAAVLSSLYRGLYKASTHDAHSISGCLSLLQLWAYERVSTGKPVMTIDCTILPRIVAWSYDKNGPRRIHPHHNIFYYRECFDGLVEGEVNWTPYTYFHNIYSECNENKDIWDVYNGHEKESALISGVVRTPLICMDIVEYQLPERVLKQFAEIQDIPVHPPTDLLTLRMNPRLGKPGKIIDAYDLRRQYVSIWNAWQKTIPECYQLCPREDFPVGRYLQWYRRVTRLRVAKPKLPNDSGYMAHGYVGWSDAVALLRMARENTQWLLDHPRERQAEQVYTNWLSQYVTFAAQYEGTQDNSNQNESPRKGNIQQQSNEYENFPFPLTYSGPEDRHVPGKSSLLSQSKNQEYPSKDYYQPSVIYEVQQPTNDKPIGEPCTSSFPFAEDTLITPTKCHEPSISTHWMHQVPQTPGSQVTNSPIDVDNYFSKRCDINLQCAWKKPMSPPKLPAFLLWNKADFLEGKQPCKPLKLERTKLIREALFSRPSTTISFPVSHTKYVLNDFEALSLRPGEELFDSVIESYSHLLKDRENRRCGLNSNTLFVPPFVSLAMRQRFRQERVTKSKKTRGETIEHIHVYLSNIDGWEKIHEIERVFLPFHTGISGESGHYILFIVDLTLWQVWLIDPLYDNTKTYPYKDRYADEIGTVKKLFPSILRLVVKNRAYASGDLKLTSVTLRPKQQNGVDCGVFVCKYMDYLLQGYNLAELTWSTEDVECFRYRIASELLNGWARKCRVI